MIETEVFVFADLGGSPILVGRLWARARGHRESATFEYDEGWLSHEDRFALEPALKLGPGPFHTAGERTIFGAIGDSAPDRWGRTLMRRAERQRAIRAGEAPRSLREIDFLLRPTADMHALWRRIVFNILISNTDDHLRNHGFLYESADGWRLSPAYDLNPVPTDIKPRVLATNIDEDDGTAALPLAMSVAEYFELDASGARVIAREVGEAVSRWREEAAALGFPKPQISRMVSAFEHDDLNAALGST